MIKNSICGVFKLNFHKLVKVFLNAYNAHIIRYYNNLPYSTATGGQPYNNDKTLVYVMNVRRMHQFCINADLLPPSLNVIKRCV